MKFYTEVDNTLKTEETKKKGSKKDSCDKDKKTLAEANGLSKNAKILME